MLLVAGCGSRSPAEQASAPGSTATPGPVLPTRPPEPPTRTPPRFQVATLAPQETNVQGPQPTAPGAAPIDPSLSAFVDGAKADLARRLGATLDAIAVIEARGVTWPNPGLGCPQPGMAYKQVPVDGLLIRLSLGGRTFSYHGGGGKPPFLCEHPEQQLPSPPRMDQ